MPAWPEPWQSLAPDGHSLGVARLLSSPCCSTVLLSFCVSWGSPQDERLFSVELDLNKKRDVIQALKEATKPEVVRKMPWMKTGEENAFLCEKKKIKHSRLWLLFWNSSILLLRLTRLCL